MKLKQLFTDDEAVSPVIGVILMVAITVILAAVIGTFVLGLGNQVGNNAPQASFTTDFTDEGTNGDVLQVVHNGGAQIDATQLTLKASETIRYDSTAGSGVSLTGSSSSFKWTAPADTGSDVSAGDSVRVYAASSDDLNDATVRLIWTSSGGDSSAELAKWTGPDAS